LGPTFRLVLCGALLLAAAFGQQGEGPENDLDHAVKVSDDVLWHLDLDSICEVRTFSLHWPAPEGNARARR
jgi:hypothetical protein